MEDGTYRYFWEIYSKRNIPLEELDLSLPWRWSQVIMYNQNITLEYIEENKEFILNTYYFKEIENIKGTNLKTNINKNKIIVFLTLLNKKFLWDDKENVLKNNNFTTKWLYLGGDSIGSIWSTGIRLNVITEISKRVKFPKEVYTEIITNRENSIYLKLYGLDLETIIKSKYLEVEHIEYLYENIDKFPSLVKKDDDGELDLYCDHPNITIELLEKYHTTYFLDLEYNPSISWYHYSKYPHLFQNRMYFRKIIQYNKQSELEYKCDKLHYIKQIIKIQRWWLHKIYYNPKHIVCQNRLNAQYDSYT